MRFFLCAVGLVALGACTTSVPDSGAGVGFDDYDAYRAEKRARDAQLSGGALPAPDAVSSESLDATGRTVTDDDAESIAAEAEAALAEADANSGESVVHASPDNPAPTTVNTSTGISGENDFEAVGERRSIESDAALIARNRARYKVIEPEALPSRSGAQGPNIVAYALSSKHPVGAQVYSRVGFNKESKFRRNCAKYASPDRAQEDFLSRGGPQKDRLGLDPDGDGYACSWNPAPFQKAVGG
ncbi:hypothetical protein FDP25_14155 [Roseovarius sp. A21]|uniref:Excalibur calcium-binding domain-containing protein n=1 Tax=Roseovarius bejariae TaxID=2576383 RepID=A0A844CPP4_9RHOB|nr:hypothetical protein [Roseovarius bejariae]MRU16582.1 hypothetical protein [Roseovarius bejariae]